MIGAIIGDIVGSVFEFCPVKHPNVPLFQELSDFTDDTVLTVATASAILGDGDYAAAYKKFGRKYHDRGYGGTFRQWIWSDDTLPYNSWGNGSAMRVSPVGFAFDTVEEVLDQAKRSAAVTHDHPEGIKGAQATSLAILMARTGSGKDDIKSEIITRFGYDLDRTIDQIRPTYSFEVSCQRSVPEAIIAFLESTDYESAIRGAISLGGDSDTQACIAGGIAQAFYKEIPEMIKLRATALLPDEFLKIITEFEGKFGLKA
ncbi:MAG: ADP-ribosylglycohydrolase family protein [Planctomycetota bacterium]|jgi:ADP-ribosylglycohydrolase